MDLARSARVAAAELTRAMDMAVVGEDAFQTAREGPGVGCPLMVSLGSGLHFEEAIWFNSLGT